jgi:RNA polymerase sigma-70 factor (ECF subfamily)
LKQESTNIYDHDSDDARLVALAGNGVNGAFRLLVERHSRYVAGIVSRFMFREEDCREIVQDTFVRIWKHLPEFDGRGKFTTWIYTITYNICLDRVRHIRRRPECRFSEEDIQKHQVSVDGDDPFQTTDAAVLAGAIQKYARQLAATQQLIFVLRDVQDLPVEEVCMITGFDAVKVKTNLYHARKYIREKLTKGGYL